MKLLIADDVVKARKRMRNAWIAGFAAAGIGLINALISFPSAASESRGGWSNGQFIFVILESSLMAVLAYGIMKRLRAAAVVLFVYFLISRIPLLAMGLMRLEVLPLQLLFGYLFFQGMRGTLTFHHLTHPQRLNVTTGRQAPLSPTHSMAEEPALIRLRRTKGQDGPDESGSL